MQAASCSADMTVSTAKRRMQADRGNAEKHNSSGLHQTENKMCNTMLAKMAHNIAVALLS